MREKEREKESERERGKGKRGEGKERRMCEQQRCISVQRSIHRVEVNARPYSGSRKERKGGRVGGSREEGALRGREGGRAEGTGAEWKKMNKHPVRNGGGELPRSAPCALFLLSPFFFRTLLSLSFFSSFLFLPFSLSPGCHSSSIVPQFCFTMHRRLQRRASYFPNDFLLTSKYVRSSTARSLFFSPFSSLFLCEKLISRAHMSIIRAL